MTETDLAVELNAIRARLRDLEDRSQWARIDILCVLAEALSFVEGHENGATDYEAVALAKKIDELRKRLGRE